MVRGEEWGRGEFELVCGWLGMEIKVRSGGSVHNENVQR